MQALITAYDFGVSTRSASDKDHRFGCDRAKAVAALRRLADALEQGLAIQQSAEVITRAATEDFAVTELRFTYHETPKKDG